MNMDSVLSDIMQTANEAQSSPDDYIASDGLKYCGKCHTPKEAFFPEGSYFGSSDRYPVLCKCAAEKEAQHKAQQQEAERMERISQLRSAAFKDIPASGWRFENAAVMTPQLSKAKSYADKWEDFKSNGIGLLLFGDVGTGKSYAAGCIANDLIEKSVVVKFSAMSRIVNHMQGTFGDDRENFMKQLMRPELLILDDLGAERSTSFGKECVFDVVNRRLLTGKPMIVTTNITLSAMKATTDLDDRRIYDQILEVCIPVQFKGQNFREVNRKANMQKAIEVLGE
ncbi:MAG: ATP-binding protein [Oscillospiraceae bacterium]|nr:ATP-binding protein [Oscillospiraceae bacterium]